MPLQIEAMCEEKIHTEFEKIAYEGNKKEKNALLFL